MGTGYGCAMSVTEKLAQRLPKLGERSGSGKPVVAVVKLHGVITPTPSTLESQIQYCSISL